MTPQQRLRNLPAVDTLLQTAADMDLIAAYGREPVLNHLREVLESSRQAILNGQPVDSSPDAILTQTRQHLEQAFRPTLHPVINATGVIIHTNLGRALLSKSAQQAVLSVAGQYNTLEFNMQTGKRGSRYVHAEKLLCDLTGAEAALVVNNNASALVLLLSALAHRRGVILSRAHLVEIGGGFRIPDIMAQSGAHLVEVGTTNRTRQSDYESAIDDNTALLMRVHSSNFRQIGFVQETPLAQMAAVAHENDCYLVDDIGSGALLNTDDYGLLHEPTVQESIAAGADLVAFSGDKLLGGPQAGIMVGRSHLIQQLKRHPLARAVRADKLCYAALNATLDHYRRGEAIDQIPVWQMIARTPDSIRDTAESWAQHTGGTVIGGESTVGGGSLPGSTLPTWLLALDVPAPDALMAALRDSDPAVIARVMDDRVLLDPRTVLPEQTDSLLTVLHQCLKTV